MTDLQQRLADLDSMTGKGQLLEALEAFYAEDCSFTEATDGATRTGRKAQHDHLSGFIGSLKGFNSATLHSSAAGDDVTLSEWTFDMTAGDGSPIVWKEVLVRRWRDGAVVEERFYNATA